METIVPQLKKKMSFSSFKGKHSEIDYTKIQDFMKLENVTENIQRKVLHFSGLTFKPKYCKAKHFQARKCVESEMTKRILE